MRRIIIVAVWALVLVSSASPALADHTHARLTGNGSCVVLAASGGENQVQLPHADEFPANRQHPLHVNVHLGHPGMIRGEHVIWVLGPASDANCDGYVND